MGIVQDRLQTIARATAQQATQKLNPNASQDKITSMYARLAFYVTLKEEVERQGEWHSRIAQTFYEDAEQYSQKANKMVQLLLQAGVSSGSIDTFVRCIPQVEGQIEEKDSKQ